MIIVAQLDGAVGAEAGAVRAEGAGAEIELAGDPLALFTGFGGVGDRLAGADTLAHVAADALVRMEDDSAAVIRLGRTRRRRKGDGAGLGEELGQSFFHKREIHYF